MKHIELLLHGAPVAVKYKRSLQVRHQRLQLENVRWCKGNGSRWPKKTDVRRWNAFKTSRCALAVCHNARQQMFSWHLKQKVFVKSAFSEHFGAD